MGSRRLIVNEVLAYIQNAIGTMDDASIVQVCKTNFNESEVSASKTLLFQTLGKSDVSPRDGIQKNLQKVIYLLKETNPDQVPTFVAKDLHRLPTKFDHIDVTRLLQDITALKARLSDVQSKLEAADYTISELFAQVALLSNTVCRSPVPDNKATKKLAIPEAQRAFRSSFGSVHMDASPALSETSDTLTISSFGPLEAPHIYTAKPQRAKNVGTREAQNSFTNSFESVHMDTSPAASEVITTSFSASVKSLEVRKIEEERSDSISLQSTSWAQNEVSDDDDDDSDDSNDSDDGFSIVGKKKKTKPLYVSRLQCSTRTEDIVEYLKEKTGLTLKVERLESRHDVEFNSYVVRVPSEYKLSPFMKHDFWPRGVVCRRFHSRPPPKIAKPPGPYLKLELAVDSKNKETVNPSAVNSNSTESKSEDAVTSTSKEKANTSAVNSKNAKTNVTVSSTSKGIANPSANSPKSRSVVDTKCKEIVNSSAASSDSTKSKSEGTIAVTSKSKQIFNFSAKTSNITKPKSENATNSKINDIVNSIAVTSESKKLTTKIDVGVSSTNEEIVNPSEVTSKSTKPKAEGAVNSKRKKKKNKKVDPSVKTPIKEPSQNNVPSIVCKRAK